MPKGVYIRSEEEKERCLAWGQAKRNSKLSEDHKKKIGQSLVGRPVWNQNLNKKCTVFGCNKKHFGHGLCSAHYTRKSRYGSVNVVNSKWPKGKKHTPETKLKCRLRKLGYKHTLEARRKLSLAKQSPFTKINNLVRRSFEYKAWRTSILQRDKYACVLCGIKGVQFQVDHHPKSFAQILRDNHIRTMEQAIECEELWDIQNNRTLCIPCHIKTPNYLKRLSCK